MDIDKIAVIGGQIIGLFSVLGVFGMISWVFWVGYKEKQLHHEQVLAAIEKGADIPIPPIKERNYRNQGLIWLFVGLAFLIAIWISSGMIQGAIWGLLPIAIGIALLLIHKYESKDNSK
ncbi:MAG: hypothetical protein ISR82_07125 [Candidatus Marinimicrobia bacterium]|nr:hypothetical protein [Candidatus Neomarinimicrobiota bacterium]MBL7010976.1 hypothetical protein [Candidatus Neomarinimicrobiota bacterium]MBL7031124.1 hypothetical protein [Candidatus Neomarinimicrobiota bacterium]